MRLDTVNVAEFTSLIRSCSGRVCLMTAEGDCLQADSLLCAVIGLASFFKAAENQDILISCENPEDQYRIEQFIASNVQ